MMNKLLRFMLISLLFLLSACRSEENSPAVSNAGASLTLAVPDGTTERYRTLAEAFMAENEDVTIHVKSMERLAGNDPNPARALAQSADIFLASVAFAGDWQSLTLDLTPHLPQWLKRGQIVLVWPATMPPVNSTSRVRNPNLFAITPLIKRVVALPGDVIVTHIADIPEFEQQHHVELHNKIGERVWNIPQHHFFVKGEVRGIDSAVWGPLPFSSFLGIVLMKLPTGKT